MRSLVEPKSFVLVEACTTCWLTIKLRLKNLSRAICVGGAWSVKRIMGDLFRNTLGPSSWILMGLIPPAIFALYFLKLKRQPSGSTEHLSLASRDRRSARE